MTVGFKATALRGLLVAERLVRGGDPPCEPDAVRSVLVLAHRIPMGCCIHLTPALAAIKQARPGITLTIATRGMGAEVLRHSPEVDHLIVTPNPLDDMLGAVRTLRAELKRLRLNPDCVLTGASDGQTRVAVMSVLSGAGWRGGFTQLPEMYRSPLRYDAARSMLANNLELASLVGGSTAHREPAVYFAEADLDVARRLLHEANPQGRPVLTFVTQGSGGQSTGWHTDRFAEVARYADAELGAAVVWVGAVDQKADVERSRATAGVGVSVAGRTSVPELAALLAMSDAMVSIDTGPMHLGRSVGVPMVVIGPSWQKPIEWMPLGLEHIRVLRGEDRAEAPPGYLLDEVQVAEVKAALAEILQAYPPSAPARAQRVRLRLSSVDHCVG